MCERWIRIPDSWTRREVAVVVVIAHLEVACASCQDFWQSDIDCRQNLERCSSYRLPASPSIWFLLSSHQRYAELYQCWKHVANKLQIASPSVSALSMSLRRIIAPTHSLPERASHFTTLIAYLAIGKLEEQGFDWANTHGCRASAAPRMLFACSVLSLSTRSSQEEQLQLSNQGAFFRDTKQDT